jgi:hypothetical protein
MLGILLGIAFIVLASKTAPALAQRISTGAPSPDVEQRMRALEEIVEEMRERFLTLGSESHERLVDLEERMDFAERVIQQARDRTRLEPGEFGPEEFRH